LARQWARERSEQEIEAQIEYMISTHDWHHVAERVALIFEDLAKPRHGKSDRLRNSSAHS